MEAVKTVGLTKRYRDLTAVDGLDLTVNKGELFALLGVNGAGKSTTVRMLSGLARPTAGDAFIMGKSIVSKISEVKRLIAVSPQETAVAPKLTVKENIEFMCGVYGLSHEERKNRTEEFFELFGLSEISGKRAGSLSGGWQRRLSIALAMLNRPSVLFLDEPTLGLDVIARSKLWDIIRSLKGSTTVILTTHYMEEAELLSDRVGIMKSGRLCALGTPEELKSAVVCDRFEDAFIAIVKEAEK